MDEAEKITNDWYFSTTDTGYYKESYSSEGFHDGKTFTCDKCGKVGNSFSDMAQEACPADVNANHQIPIFGDQVKPRGIGESKKANEIEAGRVYRMFNYNNGNPICNLCGVNVKDNEDVWEDHLVNTHGYKIESNMRDRDVDIDYIDGSDVPTSGIYESKANEGYVTFDKNGINLSVGG